MLKTKKKRMILAISLLLISAVLVTSASFAWFAMNTKAKANNFMVEANSDSQYLQISNTSATSGYNTSVNHENTSPKNLRLVTNKVIGSSETVYKNLTFTMVSTDTYYTSGDYYQKADSDVGVSGAYNYIKVDGLQTGTAVAGNFVDLEFVQIKDSRLNGNSSDIYYSFVNNDYVKVIPTTTDSLYGYFTLYQLVTGTYAAGKTYYLKDATGNFNVVDPSSYTAGTTTIPANTYLNIKNGAPNGIPASDTTVYSPSVASIVYWKKDTSGNFSKNMDLNYGTNVKGLYTLTTPTTENNAGTAFAASNLYYVVNNDDYVCIGTPAADTPIAGYRYWGRAYSTDLNAAQGTNTLNVLSSTEAETNYYLKDTLYLRQAANTNHAHNLRVSEVTVSGTENALSPAIRVLIVATNESGVTETAEYNNTTKEITHSNSGKLFADLLGDEAEVITVQVYIYFDGTDTVANNNSLGSLNGQTVSIEFAIDELSYNTVTP